MEFPSSGFASAAHVAATRTEHLEDAAIGIDLAESGRHDRLGDIAAMIFRDVDVEHR